ncbi:macrophage mannose receptor 1-like [Brachionichthys hirsutus]|uniref:macrophage mannose receptor 1-like n=1 Tax=Brachionichthys hirsutus TaxID=412623 RepID=UPI0036043333
MEKGVLSILVLSGLCDCTLYPHQYVYHFISEAKTWSEARQYCRTTHVDLATVNDLQDLERVNGLTAAGNPFVFLGLHKGWDWSLSPSDDYMAGEPAYWNWASGQPGGDHRCGSMGPTGELFAADCGVKMNFSCYVASAKEISLRFTLEEDAATWAEAQAYCRRTHTGLARVRNQFENEELQRIAGNSQVQCGNTL